MTNILVVFTGGTIGSKKQGSAIDVRDTGSYMLIEAYKEAYPQSVQFTAIQPLNILSENLTPGDWQILLKSLAEQDLTCYDGVIITHGSDTLAYTANLLGMFLQHLNLPLFIVASNYPIGDVRANGLRNFAAAVALIEQGVANNSYVIYENNKHEMKCYLATRIMQCETFTDQFSSPYRIELAQFTENKLEFVSHPLNISEQELMNRVPHQFPPSLTDGSKSFKPLLYIKSYVGIDYSWLQWNTSNKPVAIIHDLYHSGTANASEASTISLVSLIQRANTDGIPVYLAPIRNLEEAIYASTGQLVEAGAIAISGISVEALLAKLHMAALIYEGDTQQQRYFVQSVNVNFEKHE